MDVTVTYTCILPDECGVPICQQEKLQFIPRGDKLRTGDVLALMHGTNSFCSLSCLICIILGPFEALDDTFVDRSVLGCLCRFSSVNSGPNKDGSIWRAWTRYPCRPWVDMFCAASVVECGGNEESCDPLGSDSFWSTKYLYSHILLSFVVVHP